MSGFSKVFEILNIKFGYLGNYGSCKIDNHCQRQLKRKSSEAFKKGRKVQRGVKKGFINKENEVEGGKSYSPGKYYKILLNVF